MSDRWGTDIRDYNRGRVLDYLQNTAATTRKDLAQITGLSRATVTSIVGQLIREGTVQSVSFTGGTDSSAGAGRRPQFVGLVRRVGYGIAAEIGHERVQVVYASADGHVIAHESAPLSPTADATEAVRVTRALSSALVRRANLNIDHCLGTVISVPEPLDRHGFVARSGQDTRWRSSNPRALLSDALGREVWVENDANLAVVGERIFGVGAGVEDLFYVKVAHGIGMGLVLNGRLVRGTNGLAGEIGHTQVREDGLACVCGNRGCLYTLVTGQFLSHHLQPVTRNPELGLAEVSSMGRKSDAAARRVLQDAGFEVGHSLANLANALNPKMIVVAGILAESGPWMHEGITQGVARYAEPQIADSLSIQKSALSNRGELMGAVAMAVGIAPID